MTKASRLSAPQKQRTTRSSAPQPSLAPSSSTPNLQLSHDVDFEDPDPRDTPYSPGEALTRSSSITPPPKILVPAKNYSEIEKLRKKKKAVEVVGPEDRNIAVKPVLTYKLSNATKSTEAVCLGSDADWEGCLKSVTAAEKPSKPISVKINITEQSVQYIASLHVKLKIKLPSAVGAKTGRGKQKIQIMDLEHAESGDDDFDDGLGIMEKEKKRLGELQGKYSRCQLCCPDKACKVDVNGNHCRLSNNQLRAWSMALVCVFLSFSRAQTDPFQAPPIVPSTHWNLWSCCKGVFYWCSMNLAGYQSTSATFQSGAFGSEKHYDLAWP
ncbi:hypothetical protein B0H14DRAFT_2638202 [Mycena olivaceomarginata]|nr:hypothetical protein B0H14DRAFT_2638202 [Mycena olivaceomarginata]